MSTFKGFVPEFPDIAIDYFRKRDEHLRPPKALFLSHIHSDHLQGLESNVMANFIYCSPITEVLLTNLQRREHRVNLAQRKVERREITYNKLAGRLRPIPLETPTKIELKLHEYITVTLFDANHCPGAVMFLIESETHSILYTGDIRAEAWWVEALKRHPVLIPYRIGLRKLDKIYLDTSCLSRKTGLDECFPPKSDGIAELLHKMELYPKDVVFHFQAWTWGYEDVWQALATYFKQPIHVSDYHFRLFKKIRSISTQGPTFNGFLFKNTQVGGSLTTCNDVRLHSCDFREKCPGLKGKKVVYIKPIVTRCPGGFEVEEAGAAVDDELLEQEQLSVDNTNLKYILTLLKDENITTELVRYLEAANKGLAESVPLKTGGEDTEISASRLKDLLLASMARHQKIKLEEESQSNLLQQGPQEAVLEEEPDPVWAQGPPILDDHKNPLPHRLTFPFSRHSSLPELRHFIEAFKPQDIYPCVTDLDSYTPAKSINALFGDLCSGTSFTHDLEMQRDYPDLFDEVKLKSRIINEQKDNDGYEENDEEEEEERETQRETQYPTSPIPSSTPCRTSPSPPSPPSSQRTATIIKPDPDTIDLTSPSPSPSPTPSPPPSSQRAMSPKRHRKTLSLTPRSKRPRLSESTLIDETLLSPLPPRSFQNHHSPSPPPAGQHPRSSATDATDISTTSNPLIGTTETPLPSSSSSFHQEVPQASPQEVLNEDPPLIEELEQEEETCSQNSFINSQASQGSCDGEAIRLAAWAALGMGGLQWGRDVRLGSLVRVEGGEVEL